MLWCDGCLSAAERKTHTLGGFIGNEELPCEGRERVEIGIIRRTILTFNLIPKHKFFNVHYVKMCLFSDRMQRDTPVLPTVCVIFRSAVSKSASISRNLVKIQSKACLKAFSR